MKKGHFHQHHQLDKSLPTPFYMQLVNAVLAAIREGRLHRGDLMPSINMLSAHYKVARATIEKAYSELRETGVIGSHQGKGFYVKETTGHSATSSYPSNVIGSYQQAIYEACSETLGSDVRVEMLNLSNDPQHFARIMQERKDEQAAFFIVTVPKTASAGC